MGSGGQNYVNVVYEWPLLQEVVSRKKEEETPQKRHFTIRFRVTFKIKCQELDPRHFFETAARKTQTLYSVYISKSIFWLINCF